MATRNATREMIDDVDDIERWAMQIEDLATDAEIQVLASRIRLTARDIFD